MGVYALVSSTILNFSLTLSDEGLGPRMRHLIFSCRCVFLECINFMVLLVYYLNFFLY